MLKKIPAILPPELLKVLMEMGHGDEIVIGDGNFPAASTASRLVRCDGHSVAALLEAILQLFPLDHYVPQPAFLMAPRDPANEPPCWQGYREIIQQHEPDFGGFQLVERFAFYEQAKRAYAVVSSGDTAIYANIILKKGIL